MTTTQERTEGYYIDGEWLTASETMTVRSPYSGEVVAHVSCATAAAARRAIDAAASAMASPMPPWQRADILEAVSGLLQEDAEEFARLICAEAGKPLRAARVEVARAVNTFALAGGEARRLVGHVVPVAGTAHGRGHVAWTVRVPVGVVGAISPFNFPLNLVVHKLAPALAAGCAVVLKPASQTPLSALRLAAIYERAGLPAGWVNVVPGRASEIGDVLVEDERVRMISFTGSAEVGWGLRARAPRKRVALELGNASPVIVMPDADLELAASKVATHAFNYAGQTCVSVQRVYVHQGLIDEFLRRLIEKVERLVVGDPADEMTDVGPLIDANSRDRLLEWIDEACAGGAELLTGGLRADGLLGPTVLRGVTREMQLGCREAFGPICSVSAFADLESALEAANATEYGLQAAIFTGSIATAMRAVHALDFGGVLINEAPEWRTDQMPYGGVKESGNTREGSAYTVLEMTEERLVVLRDPAGDAAPKR